VLVANRPPEGTIAKSQRTSNHLTSPQLPLMADLPDPDQSPGTDVVIFDGDCRFCEGQVRNLRRLDCCANRLSYLSLHDARVAQRYPDLAYDDLMAQMFVVDTQGNRYGGSDAVRYLSRRLPLLWPIMPLLHLPGTAGIWRWGYQQVAQRRYQISGKNCETDACSVHLRRSSK